MNLVRNLVRSFVRDKRTIILTVLPANMDISTQEILALAEEYDRLGERTLGILTKADLVTEPSAQTSVCNLVLGKRSMIIIPLAVFIDYITLHRNTSNLYIKQICAFNLACTLYKLFRIPVSPNKFAIQEAGFS